MDKYIIFSYWVTCYICLKCNVLKNAASITIIRKKWVVVRIDIWQDVCATVYIYMMFGLHA